MTVETEYVALESKYAKLERDHAQMLNLLKGCDYIFRQGMPVSNQSTLASDIRSLLAALGAK